MSNAADVYIAQGTPFERLCDWSSNNILSVVTNAQPTSVKDGKNGVDQTINGGLVCDDAS